MLAQSSNCTYNTFHEHTSSVMDRRQQGKEANMIEQKQFKGWNGSGVHHLKKSCSVLEFLSCFVHFVRETED